MRTLFVIIALTYFMFVTYFTGNLFSFEVRGSAFDSLLRSLLHGNATVDMSAIGAEAFIVNNKIYTYFGPFPALLRIPTLFFPELYGKWARLSGFLAAIFSTIGFLRICKLGLLLNKNTSEKIKEQLELFSVASFAFGTPILFLISCTYIYHEVRLWGLCWSIWSIYFFLKYFFGEDKKYSNVMAYFVFSGLALLSREVYGLCFLLLGVFLYLEFIKGKGFTFKANFKFIYLMFPLIISLTFQMWYNFNRFNSVFTFVDYRYYYGFLMNKESRAIDFANDQALDPVRIPYAVKKYFMYDKDYFLNSFPYVRHLYTGETDPLKIKDFKKYHYYTEYIIPLTIVSIWLIIGSLLGLFNLYLYEQSFLLRIVPLVFFFPFLVIFSHPNISQRYSADMLLFHIFNYFFFLLHLDKMGLSQNKIRVYSMLFKFFCIFSIITTILSTLQWNASSNFGTPKLYKARLNQFFSQVNNAISNKF